MNAPWTFLNFAMEDAIKEYIEQTDNPTPPVNIYRTCEVVADGGKIVEPLIAISCDESGPVPGMDIDQRAQVQNQSLRVTLAIQTHATNEAIDGEPQIDGGLVGRAFHGRLVGRVMDLLYAADLVQSLNNFGNQIGIGINQIDTPRVTTTPADHSYVSKIVFLVHAFPYVVTQ